MRARRVVRHLAIAAVLAAGLLAVRSDMLADKASTEALGGPDRYLTHLSTDKPIYRIGDKVFIRGVLLRANDHTPLKGNIHAFIQIQGPKGDTVASGHAGCEDSVFGFTWQVPAGQAGGEYTIKATYPGYGHPPAERKFDIRAYRPPRLKSQIVFVRDGYGPGDEVVATLHVERAEGGIPDGAKVTPIARVDGAEVFRGKAAVDAKGNCTVRFKLPPEIERGEGTLALVIEDGGVVETAAKTIPILLQTIDLQIYPEGGYLVAGLPCRAYVEGKTPAKKPADVAGVIVDAAGNQVASFRTEHEGRGRAAFTPKAGGKYTLKITEPSGIKTTYPLPEVRGKGGVIRALDEVTPADEPVRLMVATTSGGRIAVTLSEREMQVSRLSWEAAPMVPAQVVLTPPPSADGVLVATLWDAKGTPLAERLVFRKPAKSVLIALKPDKPSYVPGGKAKLTVTTTDAAGNPVGAVVGLTVTDDSVLEMIEKREQAPRLPVMVLLEPDVRELADAHVYLDAKNPKAPLALDLLLGTQGWRRFAFVDTAKFLAAHGDKARTVLALRMVSEEEKLRELRDRAEGGRLGGVWHGRRGGVPMPKGAVPMENDFDRGPVLEAAKPGRAAAPVDALAAVERVADERQQLAQALKKADGKAKEEAGRLFRRSMADRLVAQTSFVVVRVYAHKARADRKPNERSDFAETLFWHAGIKTDPKTGEASVEFDLNDSVTSFKVLADGFGADGALGQGTGVLESVEPFYIEPKLPLEVTAGDVVQLPVSLINGLDSGLPGATLKIEADPELRFGEIGPVMLGAKARERQLVRLRIGHLNGETDFILSATAGPYSDKVTRKLKVVPLGFPVELGFGGMVSSATPVAQTLEIPAGVVPRSLTTAVAIYPTPLANLTEALARLIREPSGCFEQTSSTTYPLVMAQQYFMSHTGVDPALIERSRTTLDKGYKRLTSFECKQHGYEWFAADPGHEALTAYGLLEFTDMAKVREVDSAMLARTRDWLLNRRDKKGGFTRARRALHTWIVDRDCSNAYILWALLESGTGGKLTEETASLAEAAKKSENSYVLALAANVLHAAGDKAAAGKLMGRLAEKQAKEGFVDGGTASIVGSGGEALRIETTALAILAWLREPAYAGNVEKSIRYLADACKAGRYGSTQSTVLALRAIVAYDKSRAKPKAPGKARVYVDGQPVGDSVAFTDDTQGAIKLPDIAELLSPGKHTIELKMEDGSEMPYALTVGYHNTVPDSAKACKVALKVRLGSEKITEGGITEAQVTMENTADEVVPTPIAIVGLPGGLEPRHDQLKELVKAKKIAAYEVLGREVVLYWRELQGGQKVELPISLVAAVPGTYTGPASRAYLYYTDEHKHWVGGLKVAITPR